MLRDTHIEELGKREITQPILALTIKRPTSLSSLDHMDGLWEVRLPFIHPTCLGAGKTVESAVKQLVERLQDSHYGPRSLPFLVTDEWLPLLLEAIPDEYRLTSILALRDRDASADERVLMRTWVALGGIGSFQCTRFNGHACTVAVGRYNYRGDIDEYKVLHPDSGYPLYVTQSLAELDEWLFVPEDHRPS